MNLETVKALDTDNYMNIFGARTPVSFVRGDGVYLYDTENKEYMDFLAGIAVCALGYNHPSLTKSIKDQLDTGIIHTSSLYYIESQAKLASMLVKKSCADRVMFANSGAEANEGAMKLAKIYHYKRGNAHKSEIITLKNSFHGRTLGTVAATGQEKYQKPYRPLLPGVFHADINDFDSLLSLVSDNTAAIMLELIQGESGVRPVEPSYLQKVYALCKEKDIILIFDEVQTGIGRTGKLFAYENYGIEPDIFTLAKGLGGGVPIGAVCAKQFVADGFEPGDHGTTFGGNPLACQAAIAVLEAIENENILDNAKCIGEYLKNSLKSLNHKRINDVRGMGLLVGIGLDTGAADVRRKLFECGVLVSSIGDNTIRLAPPLVVTKEHIDKFIKVLQEVL